MKNIVYIATSLDGYIADKNDGLDWLQSIPNPDNLDFGWSKFMDSIDAVVMGRTTFEKVCSFNCPWPYSKPVFVLSNFLKTIPKEYEDKVELINGPLSNILKTIHQKGYLSLYIDGGTTINNFLKEDLIDEIIITIIPILLGEGIPLFRQLPKALDFEHVKTEVFLNAIVQNHYRRKK